MDKVNFIKKSQQFLLTENNSERVDISKEIFDFISDLHLFQNDNALAIKMNFKLKNDIDNFLSNPNYHRSILATFLQGTSAKL